MVESEPATATENEIYGLPRTLVGDARAAIEAEDAGTLTELVADLHPADTAALIETLSARERSALVALVPGLVDGDVLSELTDSLRDDIVERLPRADLAEAVRGLDSDDMVDLVETLDEDVQEMVLSALPASERMVVEKALAFPEGSAGRLMQVEVVRVPEDWTVGEASAFLRASHDLPDQFYHVLLVDARMRPVGYCTLGRILSSPVQTKLKDITEDSFRTFHVLAEEEEVARAFNRYHLIPAPIVDDAERLVGVVTIDDAVRILDEELEEDMLSLAGVGGDSSVTDSVVDTVKSRIPWLAVNLGTAILASFIIGLFEDAIAQIVALAVLMPIVASMGGAAGTQGLTVAVRALATKELTGANAWRIIGRELLVGLVNGAVFSVLICAVSWYRFGDLMIGVVIGMAMILNLVAAAAAGVLIPIALDKAKVDPAIASGPFVTTVTDIIGFFAFLGLAVLILL